MAGFDVESNNRLVLSVIYYDSDDPANAGVGVGPPPKPPVNALAASVFSLDGDTTRAQMLAVVQRDGAAKRAAAAARDAILALSPLGTTVPIP